MKTLIKFLALVAVLFGTSQLAQAAPLYGSVAMNGAITTDGSGNLLLTATNVTASTFNGKVYSNFVFNPASTTTGGETLFTATNGTGINKSTLSFVVSSVSSFTQGGVTFYTFVGVLSTMSPSAACVDVSPCVTSPFTFTVATTDGVNFTASGSISPAPEPNSLFLLGTGLVSAAGVMLRRRRIA